MATNDPPRPPGPPEPPIEDTDTSATPPERDRGGEAKPPLDDVVASLIDERPTRPHLVVVPTEPEAAPASKPKRKADDDPLALVLDGAAPASGEPETLEDAWKAAKSEVAKIDLGKIVDLGGLTTGLRSLAKWVENQIPSINAAVSKFLNTVEEVLTTPGPSSTGGAGAGASAGDAGGGAAPGAGSGEAAGAAEGEKPGRPIMTVVPDPDSAAKVGKEADEMEPKDNPPKMMAAAPEIDPLPAPQKDPNPGTDPAPVHDPDPPKDPNPGTDPLPIGDPLPKRDPMPGDPAPVRDPVPPPDPNPGTDPLPMGDPMPRPDPNPGTDPLPMGDPVIMPTIGSSSGGAADAGDSPATDELPDPFATD